MIHAIQQSPDTLFNAIVVPLGIFAGWLLLRWVAQDVKQEARVRSLDEFEDKIS